MPTPSRRAQLAPPGNSAHHPRGRTSTPACGVSITPTPYSTTTPTVRAYPDTPPRTPPQPPEPPTNTHPAETGHGPHQQPLQARKTCATRTPPPGAAGAHLSALQPTPKPQHAHPQQTGHQRPAHARTAAPPRPSPPPSQHEQPRPPAAATTTTTATTARDDMSTNHSSTNSAQRPDQRKHQTSRHRNNQGPKNKLQAPQGIPPGGPIADRNA